MDTGFFLFASPFNWLILLAVVAALWIGVRNIIAMQRQEPDARPAFGLNSLLYISGATILLGCLGYFGEMKSAACANNVLPGSSLVTVICTVTDSAERMRDITSCYTKSAAIMLTATAAALLVSLLWFVLKNRLNRA